MAAPKVIQNKVNKSQQKQVLTTLPIHQEMKPQRHFSFGEMKELKDGKLSLTGKPDYNTIKLCPTGNPKYSTSIRIRNEKTYLHSTGIQIKDINFGGGILSLEIDLNNSLTLTESNRLGEFITKCKSVNKPNASL